MIQNAQEFQAKIQRMQQNPHVLEQMISEMNAKNLPLHTPCIKLQVSSSDNNEAFELEHQDIQSVLEIFGPVQQVTIIPYGQALVLFKQIVSAYLAQKYLDGKWLEPLQAVLSVQWYFNSDTMTQQSQKKDLITQPNQIQEIQHPMSVQMEATNQVLSSNDLPKEKQEKPSAKFTCRYEIQIDNESKFQVARRIIGTKGSNMKRIVDLCSKDMPLYLQSQDIIKLRLRGRGSGFKEGPYQAESSEPLHLCISSRYYDKYLLACEECEALLHKVYKEYSEFCQQNNSETQQLAIKRQENPTQNVPPAYHEYSMSDQLNPQEIEYWIQIRNEARRVSDFSEADRIRSLLNQRGIILVDAKGLPCATTWKYSYQVYEQKHS